MKNVGIITFHRAHNYGAALQTYALYSILEKNLFDTQVIDYYNKYIYNQYKIFKPIRKNLLKWVKNNIYSLVYYRSKTKRYAAFNNFLNENLKLTKKYSEVELLNEILPFQNVITGSDQVWNIATVGELSDIYTLNFLPAEVNKISYAASVGNADDIIKFSTIFETKLSNLNYVSVREIDAKENLNKILKKDVEEVLDPTLLLTKDEWNEKINKFNNLNEKYILAYVVEPDSEYIKIVNDLSKKTGLKVIHFGLKNPGYNNVFKSAYTEGPLEFVNYIKNAEYVVATSFHAIVFSIIFNKKFFVVPHRKTGARVTNLLEKLDIKNRVYYSFDEFKNIDYSFDTEWDKVSIILDSERKKSLNWLNNALKDKDDANV